MNAEKRQKKIAHSDLSGLVLTRTFGNDLQDSVYIGDLVRVTVVLIQGKQVRLKFTNLTDKNIQIDRLEKRDFPNKTL